MTKEQNDSIRWELLSLGGSMDPGYVCYSKFCNAEIHRSDDKSTTPETVDLNRLEIVLYNYFFHKIQINVT